MVAAVGGRWRPVGCVALCCAVLCCVVQPRAAAACCADARQAAPDSSTAVPNLPCPTLQVAFFFHHNAQLLFAPPSAQHAPLFPFLPPLLPYMPSAFPAPFAPLPTATACAPARSALLCYPQFGAVLCCAQLSQSAHKLASRPRLTLFSIALNCQHLLSPTRGSVLEETWVAACPLTDKLQGSCQQLHLCLNLGESLPFPPAPVSICSSTALHALSVHPPHK